MATGTIKTINQTEKLFPPGDLAKNFPPGTSGLVTQDESGTDIEFYDANFRATGLKEGDRCSFIIEFDPNMYAHGFAPLAAPPVVIDVTAPQTGDVTIPDNTTLRVKNGGKITGNIVITGGTLIVGQNGSTDGGNISIDGGGAAIARNGGKITGNIVVTNGSALKVVNGGSVKGNIEVKNGYRIVLGDSVDGGGSLTGSLSVQRTKKVSIASNFTINCA